MANKEVQTNKLSTNGCGRQSHRYMVLGKNKYLYSFVLLVFMQIIYQWKWTHGKCSNERDITVSSNMWIFLERIINEKETKVEIGMSKPQAGGLRGADSVNEGVNKPGE